MSDPAIDYFRHVMAVRKWNAADLARAAGVSHSTINRPLTIPGWANRISRRTIQKVHAASGIDPTEFLQEGEGPFAVADADTPPEGTSLVPVYDVEASAGHGAVVGGEEHVFSLAFPFDYLRRMTGRANPRDLRIITVKGDSMLPTLSDDDVVMLDVSKKDLSYDGLFVVRDNGEGLLVKRIGRASRSGFITLISDNRDVYPTVERAVEDIQVIGKVLWQGRKV